MVEQGPQDPSRRRFLKLGGHLVAAVPVVAFDGMIDRLEESRSGGNELNRELSEQKNYEELLGNAALVVIGAALLLPFGLQIEEGIHNLRVRRQRRRLLKKSDGEVQGRLIDLD